MSSETEALSNIRLSAKHLSRRAVLLRGTGFAITLAFGLRPAGSRSKGLTGDRAGSPAHPNAWVSIGVDGQVTLISPASEMGQGVMTSIPLLIAEEMDADWNQVKVEQAPSDRAAYGNPGLGGVQATGAPGGRCPSREISTARGTIYRSRPRYARRNIRVAAPYLRRLDHGPLRAGPLCQGSGR